MAKSNSKAASDEDVLKARLLELARADGPRRLIGAGKGYHKALFGKTAVDRRAAELSRLADRPLVSILGVGKNETVALTAAGFENILAALTDEEVAGVALRVVEPLAHAEQVAVLQQAVAAAPIATSELMPALEAAIARENDAREAEAARLTKRRAAEAASLAAMEKWKAAVDSRRQHEIAHLTRQLRELGAEPKGIATPTASVRNNPLEPTTRDDLAFRRDVANQLASAWHATWSPDRPEIRDFLESAMWNVSGLQTIGETGELTAFHGRLHESGPGVFPGDPVRVTRPGWALEEGGDADYVVLKAVVEKPG